MSDLLTKYGFCIDDMSKIRLLEPEILNQSEKLKSECQDFISKIKLFKDNSDLFINLLDEVGNEVENEKMRTIGARNLLSSVEKQRDAEKQKIKAMLIEKSMELERLKIQYDSLKKVELDQLEIIEHLTNN